MFLYQDLDQQIMIVALTTRGSKGLVGMIMNRTHGKYEFFVK